MSFRWNGSGVEACRESEEVVELLEQFLESGFTQETAAKMVNSALVMKGQEGIFQQWTSAQWIYIRESVTS